MSTRNGPKVRRPTSANQGAKSFPTHEQRTSCSMLLKRLFPAASIHETCAVSSACSVRSRTSSVAPRPTRRYDVREVNMWLLRLVSRSISSLVTLFVALLLIGNAISTAAQTPPKHVPQDHIPTEHI